MKNKLTLAMLLACCLAVLLGSSVKVAATPTIPNPSFEDPGHTDSNAFIILPAGSTYITGWTVGGRGVDYFKGSIFASDGLYSVNYVRGPGEGGSISTTISGLIAGTAYDLSFDVIQGDLSAGTALTAIVDSTSQTYINTTANVYQRHHLLFIAGGSTASLTFAGPATGAIDSAFAHVDNVTIMTITAAVLDHFKCYEAKGDPVNLTVNLEDQFGVEPQVLVGEPKLFCNPVDKNGEGINNPTAHLTCYEIEGEGEELEVQVDNQFGVQTLKVEKPELLCVPSEKISVVPEDDEEEEE